MVDKKRILFPLAVLGCLLAPTAAQAQYSNYAFPVEKGFLDSHLDLQFQYSNFQLGSSLSSTDINVAVLSIEGQYAIKDVFEVGLNVPFVEHGWTSGGSYSTADTQFGDIFLNLKGKLFGNDMMSLALFANTMLPTHSSDYSRDYAMMIPGVAASLKLLGLELNGAFKGIWMINGGGDDILYLGLDAGAGYSLLGILTFNLALQYANSVKPSSDANILAVVPGVGVDVLDILRVGLAARIAITDDAEMFYAGRVNVLFNAGISF